MKWFTGNIPEAITLSKNKNSVFVVYIEGDDEFSKRLTEFIDDVRNSSLLESDKFVAIKIKSGSDEYLAFVQIYKVVPVPSIFFIDNNGSPIEVLTSLIDNVDKLHEKINKIAENVKTIIPSAADQASSSGTAAAIVPEESQASSAVSAEKLEHAKKLIEKKRKEKEEEDSRLAKEKELQRRRNDRELQKFKEWQADQELKNLQEERIRQKQEKKIARQRVLDQIAQDKAERAARFSNVSPQQQTKDSETENKAQQDPAAVPARNFDEARIQFRKPDGENITQTFKSSETFSVVRNYVANTVLAETNIKNFLLTTTFPRKEFVAEDNSRTLSDLQLTPSAVILIIPLTSGITKTAVATSTGNLFNTITLLLFGLLRPITTFFTYLKSKLMGTGGEAAAGSPSTDQPYPSSSTDDNYNAAQKRNLRFNNSANEPKPSTSSGTGAYQRRPFQTSSNIHRLQDSKDSDDENNTWNGNSTQQMP
uniref:UBX domain-containing protein 4 n=1 Tax=Corethrella appendiculata TaxID=1370023 RepID=U5EPD3_9DIPT